MTLSQRLMCVRRVRVCVIFEALSMELFFDAQSPPKNNASSTTWGIHDYDYTDRSKQLHLWRQDLLKIYCPSSWTIMDSFPMIPTIFRFTVLRSLRLRSLAIQTWGSNRPEKSVAIVEFCDCFGVAFWLGMFWGKGSSSIPWYHGMHPWPCRVSLLT